MENKKTSAESLRQEIHRIRVKIEKNKDTLAIELGFPGYLKKIEQFLSSGNLDSETLKRYDYGIFRLVTESYAFEQSALGRELLNLGTKIKNLANDY